MSKVHSVMAYNYARNMTYDMFYGACTSRGDQGIETVKTFLSQGGSPNMIFENGLIPLEGAISAGSVIIVKMLLEAGANPNFKESILINAANRRSRPLNLQETARLNPKELILRKAENEKLNSEILATYNEIFRLLLEAGADPSVQRKEDGYTPLFKASEAGNIEIVKMLLDRDVNPFVKSVHNRTARDVASNSRFVEIVELLKEAEEGALIKASRDGLTERVKDLMKHYNNSSFQDKEGRTALIWASINGHLEIVQELLLHYADTTFQDRGGKTALIWASYNGHTEIVKELLKSRANHFTQSITGKTALIWASIYGRTEVVKELLAAGAYSSIQCSRGRTALIWASILGHTETVKELLKVAVFPSLLWRKETIHSIQDPDGRTALIWASVFDRKEVMKEIIKAGADRSIKDNDGKTFMSFILGRQKAEMEAFTNQPE